MVILSPISRMPFASRRVKSRASRRWRMSAEDASVSGCGRIGSRSLDGAVSRSARAFSFEVMMRNHSMSADTSSGAASVRSTRRTRKLRLCSANFHMKLRGTNGRIR